jgi:hypothetical protein
MNRRKGSFSVLIRRTTRKALHRNRLAVIRSKVCRKCREPFNSVGGRKAAVGRVLVPEDYTLQSAAFQGID